LVSSFIEQLSTEFTCWNKDPNFQLFMTTESALGIPITFLESCTKANSFNSLCFNIFYQVTLESKPGIKQNMLQCYECFSGALKETQIHQAKPWYLMEELGTLVAWLHSMIQSRKDLGGWKGDYEFSLSDFRSALSVLDSCTDDPTDAKQWKLAQQLVKTVVYGGIIFHPQDQKVSESFERI